MTDTRDLFERTFALCDRQKWQHKDGSYKDASIQAKWEGWQRALEIAEQERLSPSTPDRRIAQLKGEHPAPCARFCEANAFQIEIRRLKKQLATPAQTALAGYVLVPIEPTAPMIQAGSEARIRMEEDREGENLNTQATWEAMLAAAPAPTVTDEDAEADHYTIMRMGELLAGIAIALKGPEEAMKRHGYQDLVELVQAKVFEVEILKQQLATPAPSERKPVAAHAPLPWRITEWTEQEMSSIVDANGGFIAWLPAVGAANAQLIVDGVNATPAPTAPSDVTATVEALQRMVDSRNDKVPAFNLQALRKAVELLTTPAPTALSAEKVTCPTCKGADRECTDCNGKGYNWEPIEPAPAAPSDAAAPVAIPVGVVVANDPVHGWHMRALVDWEAIGEGTKLYAAPPTRLLR